MVTDLVRCSGYESEHDDHCDNDDNEDRDGDTMSTMPSGSKFAERHVRIARVEDRARLAQVLAAHTLPACRCHAANARDLPVTHV